MQYNVTIMALANQLVCVQQLNSTQLGKKKKKKKKNTKVGVTTVKVLTKMSIYEKKKIKKGCSRVKGGAQKYICYLCQQQNVQ
jgi:hypothetical protein